MDKPEGSWKIFFSKETLEGTFCIPAHQTQEFILPSNFYVRYMQFESARGLEAFPSLNQPWADQVTKNCKFNTHIQKKKTVNYINYKHIEQDLNIESYPHTSGWEFGSKQKVGHTASQRAHKYLCFNEVYKRIKQMLVNEKVFTSNQKKCGMTWSKQFMWGKSPTAQSWSSSVQRNTSKRMCGTDQQFSCSFICLFN